MPNASNHSKESSEFHGVSAEHLATTLTTCISEASKASGKPAEKPEFLWANSGIVFAFDIEGVLVGGLTGGRGEYDYIDPACFWLMQDILKECKGKNVQARLQICSIASLRNDLHSKIFNSFGEFDRTEVGHGKSSPDRFDYYRKDSSPLGYRITSNRNIEQGLRQIISAVAEDTRLTRPQKGCLLDFLNSKLSAAKVPWQGIITNSVTSSSSDIGKVPKSILRKKFTLLYSFLYDIFIENKTSSIPRYIVLVDNDRKYATEEGFIDTILGTFGTKFIPIIVDAAPSILNSTRQGTPPEVKMTKLLRKFRKATRDDRPIPRYTPEVLKPFLTTDQHRQYSVQYRMEHPMEAVSEPVAKRQNKDPQKETSQKDDPCQNSPQKSTPGKRRSDAASSSSSNSVSPPEWINSSKNAESVRAKPAVRAPKFTEDTSVGQLGGGLLPESRRSRVNLKSTSTRGINTDWSISPNQNQPKYGNQPKGDLRSECADGGR